MSYQLALKFSQLAINLNLKPLTSFNALLSMCRQLQLDTR